MDVLVINLARSADRRAFMEADLCRLAVGHEFFPAIDGATVDRASFPHYDRSRCQRRFGTWLTDGEFGCFASHYRAWQECVRRGVPIAVLEDDVELSCDFLHVLSLAGQRIDACRLIRLAGLFPRPYRTIERIDGSHRLVRFLRGPAGTQCYALSPDAAAALVARARHWVEPVDLYIDRFWLHGVESNGILPFAAKEVAQPPFRAAIGDRDSTRSLFGKARRELFRMTDGVRRTLYNLTR